jgi:hypothetical protein
MTKRNIILAALLASSAAFAGHAQVTAVSIIDAATYTAAEGTLRGARNSADYTQFIGCSIYTVSGSYITHCWARDATGRTLSCNQTNHDPTARAVSSINAISWIRFQIDDAVPGRCASVNVTNNSMHLPAE